MGDTVKNDPLQDLVSDNTEDIDRAQLAGLLKMYVAFSKDGELTFLPAFYKLDNTSKILVILTAQKARHLLFGETHTSEALSSADIISLDVMAEGSVKSTVKRLLEKTYDIKKNADKKYYIPNYQLSSLQQKISPEDEQ